MKKGSKHSKEAIEKLIANARWNQNYGLRNKHLSEEHKRKIGLANSISQKGKIISKETKHRMSLARGGHKFAPRKKHIFTEQSKGNLIKAQLGNKYCLNRKISEETRGKMSVARIGKIPWNKGIGNRTPISRKIRSSLKYTEWRLMIFGRDNYTCQQCGKRGTFLHAHHIKKFSKYPELRFEISNGITLCKECHKEIH